MLSISQFDQWRRFINFQLFYSRKKIENIGKMTQMTQEEIVTNTKTVLQGLEALRVEHMSIIAGLTEGKKDPDKADIISKNIENIELGLGEAQVRAINPH